MLKLYSYSHTKVDVQTDYAMEEGEIIRPPDNGAGQIGFHISQIINSVSTLIMHMMPKHAM